MVLWPVALIIPPGMLPVCYDRHRDRQAAHGRATRRVGPTLTRAWGTPSAAVKRTAPSLLLARWPIRDGLLSRLIHLLDGHENDRLQPHGPARIDGQAERRDRHGIRQIDDQVHVGAA